MRQSLLLFLRANRRQLAELMLAGLLVNTFALALPLFSMLVYDKAMGNQVHDTLWALSAGMALLLGMELLLRTMRVVLFEHAGARWDTFLDERLMRGVLAAPVSRPIGVADIVSRLREVTATRDVLSAQGLMPLADLPFLLLFAAAVVLIGGPLVWVPLGFGLLMVTIGAVAHHLSVERQRLSHEASRQKMTVLVDVLTARDSLHGPAASIEVERRWRQFSQVGARAAARSRWWAQLHQQMLPVLMAAASVALLVAGVFRVEAQEMSVGGLISINLLAGRMLAVMCAAAPLPSRWREFTRALAALGQSVELEVQPSAVGQASDAAALASEGIRLDGLSVTYPSRSQPALEGLNLNLRVGEFVALVGASGSGKSSLLRVLAGQLPHAQGRMTFGGHAIDDEARRLWLHQQVEHKPQDPCFLGGSVRSVVGAGEASATDDTVISALRAAGLGSAVDRGDLALNTQVGVNGMGLSGGQRQMLALARSFHAGRGLLLLDEPTLGLDRTAQEKVLEALPKMKVGRCMVVATHAAEVIQRADRVIVLDRGRIVADAPPNRLLPSAATWPGRPATTRPAAPRPQPEVTAA